MSEVRRSTAIPRILARRGWIIARGGEQADLWSFPSADRNREMYVPHLLRVGSFEWSDIVERIAEAQNLTIEAVAREIELGSYDVSRFRIENDAIKANSIPLEAGAVFVSSLFGMIRSSATTARRPRQSIGGGYSKRGDALAQNARLGHTERGSFVFPVLLRLDDPPAETATPLPTTEHVQPESEQRRIVRTLAQSLATYKSRIIDPGREPRRADLLPVIAAGGSKELFAHVQRILDEPSVGNFEANFTWALTEMPPENAPTQIVIPNDAREIVRQTVVLMSEPRREPLRLITGPIIDIGHMPGDLFGEIVVQTASLNGTRVGKVQMRVRESQLTDIHRWMDTATTVLVEGTVERARGKTARLREIAQPVPIEESFLPGTQS